MKYIDAEKLLTEIARLRKEHTTREYRDEAALVLEDLEDYIDSLQQEQPEVDLKKIIEQTYHDGSVTDTSDMDHVDYENIARHFFNLALNTRKV